MSNIEADKVFVGRGDRWRIVGVGAKAVKDGSKIYLHLASETRFREQRNGRYPIQMADYFDIAEVEEAIVQATSQEEGV